MDESGTYGQFGEAVYDNEDHHWHFQRSKTAPHLLELPGETKIIVESDGRTQNKIFPADGKEGPTRRREKQVQALVRRNPEFQPGSGFLTDLARISEAVEESASRHDPTIGNLLAFGTTTDELARQQVEIVAFPTGPTGSDLRIVQVRKQRRGWHDLKNVHLQVPTIHGEEATWTGPGVPIQSIAFANPLEGTDPFLAVRLIMQTLIFRPVLRKKVVSNGSRLDVNFLVSVDLDQTGNQPHADVAFNPWYARQFAILDQAGCFTIWELDGKSLMKVNRVAFNRSTMENPKSGESASGDCWGRAIWVCSPSILAVCRRRNLKIFEIEGDHLLERHDLDNGLTDFGWILDMVQVPSQLGYIVVATSQHLVVYYVKHATPSKVAQVRHFRNSEDISLQLYCFSDGDGKLAGSESCPDIANV
jgi:RNA polymerase I-specific transcription initiation factor RRN6